MLYGIVAYTHDAAALLVFSNDCTPQKYCVPCTGQGANLQMMTCVKYGIHTTMNIIKRFIPLPSAGHQPLLSGPLGHAPPPLIPHSQHSPPHPHILTTCPLTHTSLIDVEEGIREVDLPGLSADEIETILSENSNWSGEQFKNFFHSAVELSEMEAKLFSGSGYESDSGYSTYDVSPITSSAPMQFGACRPAVSTSYRSISPALTPVKPSPYISLS